MRFKKLCTLILLLSIALTVHGQGKKPLYLNIEAGANTLDAEFNDLDFIRQSASDYDYYYDDYASSLYGQMTSFYAGLKLEKEIFASRLSVLSGLRYTGIITQLGDNTPSTSNYVYLLYSSEGTTTRFLRANGIVQNTGYLGIPVELKYYTTHYHFVRSYLRLGCVVNYRISNSTDIAFTERPMEQYEDEMAGRIGEPARYNSFAYGGFGLRVGEEGKPSLSVEAHFPVATLTPDAFTFSRPTMGAGVQVTLSLPINK